MARLIPSLDVLQQVITPGGLSGGGPSIQSLSTTTGAAGTSVTITGQGFGSSAGASTVTFNGTTATVSSWSVGRLLVTAPSSSTGSVRVTVGGIASNGITFTYTGSDPVPAARLPFIGSWTGIVGVQDVVPANYTKFGSTLATSSSLATINAAIQSATNGTYVELAAGTFTLGSGTLNISKSGVALRGQVDANGLPTTILNMASGSNVNVSASADWFIDDATLFGGTIINISSGGTRGSTSIVVASTPTGLAAGQMLWISAPANGSVIDGDGGFTDFLGTKPYTQAVKVTGVSGTTITFTPAINADYLSGTLQANYRAAAKQLNYAGLENISFTNTTGFFTGDIIDVQGCNQCWIKNCKLTGMQDDSSLNAFIFYRLCYGCELSHCEISHCAPGSYGSASYGMCTLHCSSFLIVNNYFHDLPNVYPLLATSGSAFAYNYFVDEPYQSATFLSQMIFFHGSHSHYNLFEGNWVPGSHNDASASGNFSHSRNNVWLRCRHPGWDATGPKDTNCNAITFENHHDNAVFAGCVLGTTGKQTAYNGDGSVGNNTIFNVETVSNGTLLRLGNYNYFNAAIPAAETTALSGGTLVTSYLYASKPTFFGSLPWPPCDPTNPTQSNTAANYPAPYRAINGHDPA